MVKHYKQIKDSLSQDRTTLENTLENMKSNELLLINPLNTAPKRSKPWQKIKAKKSL